MQKLTKTPSNKNTQRHWHVIDVKDQILGRQATKIAGLLMGKSKKQFVKNLDMGDHVVVINAKEIAVSGNKETQKKYTSYSGYPGGLKEITLEQLREKKPEDIITRAVSGMLPKNKLRKKMLARLHVFKGSEHDYQDKIK